MAKFSYENLSDAELVQRCAGKDHQAWTEFVDRFSRLVFWAIKERLSSRGCYCSQEDLADIFQSVFAALWLKDILKQVRDRQKIKTWLIMVSGNLAVDYVRKNKIQAFTEPISVYQSISEKLYDEKEELALENVLASDAANPRLSMFRQEIKNLLDEEMDKLNPKEKSVLTLDILYDMKHKDIADIVKMPLSTVSSIAVRSKEKIKIALKEKGVEII